MRPLWLECLRKFNWGNKAYALILLSAAAAIASPAQTLSTLASFDETNGALPGHMSPVQGLNGNLYGVTYNGGANCVSSGGCGTVFKVTRRALTTLYSFCAQPNCTDGSLPYAGLVEATDGNLYGTTTAGGANQRGTVFKITPQGALTTLYSFCAQTNCADGNYPWAALVQATDGNLYGTTTAGGANRGGTAFKITPRGTLTTLYSFCAQANCADGYSPVGLVQATDGTFYGVTGFSGTMNFMGGGTVFKITSTGILTTLYSFCGQTGCTDGSEPNAGVIPATDGNFYGTTIFGGAHSCGTVFKVTSAGTLTTLYSFCSKTNSADGALPFAGLVQATDGSLYGTTQEGGTSSSPYDGTVFKITTKGKLTTLYSFCSRPGCVDGDTPNGGLVLHTSGTFYGTTNEGGTSSSCIGGCGTIFSLSVGLGSFVETLPTSGKVGTAVKILGTNLTGSTAVTFNGAAAVFKVVSSSEITTTVPTGAATGKVKVTTPGGTLTSNVNFRVP